MRRYGKALKTIVICRVGQGGDLLPIHPCDACAANAANRGITIKTLEEL